MLHHSHGPLYKNIKITKENGLFDVVLNCRGPIYKNHRIIFNFFHNKHPSNDIVPRVKMSMSGSADNHQHSRVWCGPASGPTRTPCSFCFRSASQNRLPTPHRPRVYRVLICHVQAYVEFPFFFFRDSGRAARFGSDAVSMSSRDIIGIRYRRIGNGGMFFFFFFL